MVSIMGISYVFLNIQTTAFIISTIKQHNQISNKTSCQMFQLQLRMLTAPLKGALQSSPSSTSETSEASELSKLSISDCVPATSANVLNSSEIRLPSGASSR